MRERTAFEVYLRTGRRVGSRVEPLQLKFNPWHDPEDGRFTFAGQGRRFPGGGHLQLAQAPRNPRVRMGGNGGPPIYDPRTLQDAFPGINRVPAGTVIALADNVLDLSGPMRALTTDLSIRQTQLLLKEIKQLDPSYRLDTLEPSGFPSTREGQINLINRLRLDRAKLLYDRGDLGPLQFETLRYLQREVDTAYEIGLKELQAGRLSVRLSQQEALGNFVDNQVRLRLRGMYNSLGVSTARNQSVQINRRALNTAESSYSIPDSRVGDIAFDVSLTAKTLSTSQVRKFFRSDFRPSSVVIVRPSQLGSDSTYVITKPRD